MPSEFRPITAADFDPPRPDAETIAMLNAARLEVHRHVEAQMAEFDRRCEALEAQMAEFDKRCEALRERLRRAREGEASRQT
jgi:hypothetical protein